MAAIIPFPAALNHQSPNLTPHAGWVSTQPKTVVMSTTTNEVPFYLHGSLSVYDEDGDWACDVFVDAVPGLDVYEIH